MIYREKGKGSICKMQWSNDGDRGKWEMSMRNENWGMGLKKGSKIYAGSEAKSRPVKCYST